MGILDDRPGPKRSDPKRIAALKEHARKQMEAELLEQVEVLRRSGAADGDLVKVTMPGHKAKVGVKVGTALNETCYVLRFTSGPEGAYHICYCEQIKSNKAAKGIRKVKQALNVREAFYDPDKDNGTVYGDGDI